MLGIISLTAGALTCLAAACVYAQKIIDEGPDWDLAPAGAYRRHVRRGLLRPFVHSWWNVERPDDSPEAEARTEFIRAITGEQPVISVRTWRTDESRRSSSVVRVSLVKARHAVMRTSSERIRQLRGCVDPTWLEIHDQMSAIENALHDALGRLVRGVEAQLQVV